MFILSFSQKKFLLLKILCGISYGLGNNSIRKDDPKLQQPWEGPYSIVKKMSIEFGSDKNQSQKLYTAINCGDTVGLIH